MADPVLAPLPFALETVRAVADDIEALVERPPAEERDLVARLKACAAALRSVGGPTDPNAPVQP